jgi:hypothetical protein
MKIINCNNWAPRNQLDIPIPITDPPVRVYNYGWLVNIDLFYYILERVVSYNILDEDGYFNEDD